MEETLENSKEAFEKKLNVKVLMDTEDPFAFLLLIPDYVQVKCTISAYFSQDTKKATWQIDGTDRLTFPGRKLLEFWEAFMKAKGVEIPKVVAVSGADAELIGKDTIEISVAGTGSDASAEA
jgi:hypothetical protein